jgi:hypothetical protein
MSDESPEPTKAETIAAFLEERPIYASIEVISSLRGRGPYTKEQIDNQTAWFPVSIKLFCESAECGREMLWENVSYGYRAHTSPEGIATTLSRSFPSMHIVAATAAAPW